jgi:hypothetical protein
MSQALIIGSLCDEVLLAIYERETAPLDEAALRKIEEAANWFAGLSILQANPLDLSESLPHVNKLEVGKYLAERRGITIDYALYPIASKGPAVRSTYDSRGALSKKMSHLLRALADNEIEEADLHALQEALTNLSRQLVPSGRMAYN